MRLRASFVEWHRAWVFVSAEERGKVAGIEPKWTRLGSSTFPFDRIPVWWRTDPGVPGWASGAIKTGWSWINGDPISFAAGVFAGYGGTGDISACGQGSWVSFRDLPPGILGFGTYCADSYGAVELHAELDNYVDYDIATVTAHEVMHGLG